MMYRLYLIDANGRARAAGPFLASDDREAIWIAAVVYDACSDVSYGYEVWSGPQLIAKFVTSSIDNGSSRLDDVISRRQASIVKLEETLQNSFACMRQSKNLMEATAALKANSPV